MKSDKDQPKWIEEALKDHEGDLVKEVSFQVKQLRRYIRIEGLTWCDPQCIEPYRDAQISGINLVWRAPNNGPILQTHYSCTGISVNLHLKSSISEYPEGVYRPVGRGHFHMGSIPKYNSLVPAYREWLVQSNLVTRKVREHTIYAEMRDLLYSLGSYVDPLTFPHILNTMCSKSPDLFKQEVEKILNSNHKPKEEEV